MLHQQEVVAGVLLLAEQSVDHDASGVIDGQQQHEGRTMVSKPPVVAAVHLYQDALSRHSLALSRHRAGPSTGSARDGAGAPTPSTLGGWKSPFPRGGTPIRTDIHVCGLSAVRRAAHPLPAPPLLLRYGDMRRYGPLTVNTSSVDSFLPTSVQIAP